MNSKLSKENPSQLPSIENLLEEQVKGYDDEELQYLIKMCKRSIEYYEKKTYSDPHYCSELYQLDQFITILDKEISRRGSQ